MIGIGSKVLLSMPDMKRVEQSGVVVSIVQWFHGQGKRYEVHGDENGHEFITICRLEKLTEIQ